MPSYQAPLIGRAFVLLVFGVLLLTAVVLMVATLGGNDGPPIAFVVFWLFALGWNAYWWLGRIALRLTIRGEAFGWKTALASGEMPLSDLVAVRPSRMSSQILVIERTSGKPIMAMATKGNGPFFLELASRRPDVPIRIGWLGKLSDRLPGWSAFRGDD